MSTGEVVTIGEYERLKQQVSLQPCGHPYAAVRRGEEWAPGKFTQWCGWCADIDQAVQAEREACATIAETLYEAGNYVHFDIYPDEMSRKIARAIRGRGHS